MTTIHNPWSFQERPLTQHVDHFAPPASIDGPPVHEHVWTDPVTGARGFFVVDSIVGGLTTGGTRMRAGCTLSEVADLAHRMTLKTAAFGLPVGGAKAGIDMDPHHPAALEVLERFFMAMLPWLEEHWVTAEDLGVSQTDLDGVFQRLGLHHSYHAAIERSEHPDKTLKRIRNAMAMRSSLGPPVADLIGGHGVAQACLAAANSFGWTLSHTTVAIQGIGTMGGSTARFLHAAGVAVVAIGDAAGTLYDPQGLNIPELLALRDSYGEIDRSRVPAGIEHLPCASVLTVAADILVPAAFSYAISAQAVPSITALAVVEAANSATTPEAEELLAVRGIPVIPDFVANAGAAAWTWWLLAGLVGSDPEESFQKMRSHMETKVAFMLAQWRESAILPRRSAWNFAAINQRAVADTQLSVP
ncbi:Glu/Leu/Phe/Val dehydrogenase dimerization domain-containing protein [Yaniella flava]